MRVKSEIDSKQIGSKCSGKQISLIGDYLIELSSTVL